MKLAILHYHLNPGGVTQVILNHLKALDRLKSGPNVPQQVLLLHGGRRMGWPTDLPLARIALSLEVIGQLEYDEMRESAALPDPAFGELSTAILDVLAGNNFAPEETIVHVHNPTLCKNAALPLAISNVADRGYRCLLQIHDFAEDFRPKNLQRSQSAWKHANPALSIDQLYPQANHIHYAGLTGRDLAVFKAAGIPESRLHRLPNPVIATAPSSTRDDARNRFKKLYGVPADANVWLYPVRGIRRKNVGEAVLWAALANHADTVAITLPPKNPIELSSYRDWQAFCSEHSIPCLFDVGVDGGLSYDDNLAAADALLTTSVAEGFGMVFLEACLRGKPLVGRNLPEITTDFVAEGVGFDGLYSNLQIPLNLFDASGARDGFRQLLEDVNHAYGREPLSDAVFADGWGAFVKAITSTSLI